MKGTEVFAKRVNAFSNQPTVVSPVGEDNIVKAELIIDVESDWREDLPILGVFEDRQQVVDMYRAKGLRVFQVADGKF